MLEIIKYLKDKNTIKGISKDRLKILFLSELNISNDPNDSDLVIKGAGEDYLLVRDMKSNKNIFLGCVCEEFKLQNTNCNKVRQEIGAYNTIYKSCKECYLKCVKSYMIK